VQSEWDEKSRVRLERFGYEIQPVDFQCDDSSESLQEEAGAQSSTT
jgi:hypothetical protein